MGNIGFDGEPVYGDIKRQKKYIKTKKNHMEIK